MSSKDKQGRTNRSAEQVNEIRKKFLEDYENNKDLYSLEDVERVKNSDWFVKRFYLSKNKNVNQALNMLITTLRWRMEWEIPLIADWMFPIEFYKSGGLFAYECDKEGNLMVYMRTCFHKKIPELEEYEKKFLLKVFDKVDKITDGNGFGIIFDLTGTGYANVDIDFLRFLIDCTTHYPVGLKYVLVYNLPWILNAVRSTVMAFIPQNLLGVLRFGSGDEIFKYIDKDKVPDYLNGTCKRNFRQIPVGSKSVEELVEDVGLTKDDVKRIMPNFEQVLKIADHQLTVNEYEDQDDYFDPAPDEEEYSDFREMNKMRHNYKIGLVTKEEFLKKVNEKLNKHRNKLKVKENQKNNFNNNSVSEPSEISLSQNSLFNVIKVTPDKQLYFIYEPNEQSYIVHLCVENNTDENIAFKIQSTNHSIYNVTPCSGIILPKKTINCTIKTLKTKDLKKADKFLILATKVDKSKMSYEEFKSIWNESQSLESVCLHSILVNQKIDKILNEQSNNSNKEFDNKLGILVEKLHSQKESKLNEYIKLFLFLTLLFSFFCLLFITIFCFLFNDEIVDFLFSLKSNKKFIADKIKNYNPIPGYEL